MMRGKGGRRKICRERARARARARERERERERERGGGGGGGATFVNIYVKFISFMSVAEALKESLLFRTVT